MQQISFTIINHIVRIELGLSVTEYMVADLIHNLSTNPDKSGYPGWCYASKDTLGKMIDVSKKSVDRAINTLIDKDLIEKHPETKFLKSTVKWYENIIIKERDKMSHTRTKSLTDRDKMSHQHRDKMSHNNDIYNNDNNNDILSTEKSVELKEQKISVTGNVIGTKKNGEPLLLVETKDGEITHKEFTDLIKLFTPINPTVNRLYLNKGQTDALKRLLKEHGYHKIKSVIEALPKIVNQPYAPVITTPYALEQKLGQLILYMQKEKTKGGGVVDARNL